jgi:hypothetical protein
MIRSTKSHFFWYATHSSFDTAYASVGRAISESNSLALCAMSFMVLRNPSSFRRSNISFAACSVVIERSIGSLSLSSLTQFPIFATSRSWAVMYSSSFLNFADFCFSLARARRSFLSRSRSGPRLTDFLVGAFASSATDARFR